MDYLKSTLSRAILGKDIPAFPYNIGTKVDSYDGVSIWELRSGTKKVGTLRCQFSSFYSSNMLFLIGR